MKSKYLKICHISLSTYLLFLKKPTKVPYFPNPLLSVYVELGTTNAAYAKLEFAFSSTASTDQRNWDIKVSQYTCYDSNA